MPSLVEIDSVVLEKKVVFFKFCQFIFANYLHGKGRGTSFEQTGIPFTQGCFVLSLVEIGPVVLRKSRTYENFSDGRTDRQTDDGRKAIREAQVI